MKVSIHYLAVSKAEISVKMFHYVSVIIYSFRVFRHSVSVLITVDIRFVDLNGLSN
jgi:hypothetical protein